MFTLTNTLFILNYIRLYLFSLPHIIQYDVMLCIKNKEYCKLTLMSNKMSKACPGHQKHFV